MRGPQAQSRGAGKSSLQSMPIDKHKNGISANPLTPNLSSAFRQSKSPLTPKSLSSNNASPSIPAKRGLHIESATNKRTGGGQATPPSGGNITPRSAARKSRIGTDSPSTPDSGYVARSPRPRSMFERDRPNAVSAGLGISSVGLHSSGSPAAGGALTGTKGPLATSKSAGSVDGPVVAAAATHFFHADDAVSAVSSHGADSRPRPGARPAAFFHANEAPSTQSDTERSSNSRDRQVYANKFFYASEQSSQPPAPKPNIAGKSLSPSNCSSRFPSPELQRNGRPPQRPPSPLKESNHTNAPASSASPRSKHITSPEKAVRQESPLPSSSQLGPNPRRTSVSSTTPVLRKPAHEKSASTTSAQISPTNKIQTFDTGPIGFMRGTSTQQLSKSMTSPSSPELPTSNSTSLVSTDTVPSSLVLDTGQPMPHASPLQSPTKSGSRTQPPLQQLQKLNELAANARRERKVLDLEISNSSLLAINKTLEREMRKQSTELRRFRRLSRSGRISIATGSLRSMSGQSNLSLLTEKDVGRAELSDLEEMSDHDSGDSDNSEEDPDSSFDDDSSPVLSPTSRADYDASHRAKDEKRLMLDFSKHQQLFIDSQKMTQSIKRCLGWTEDLIKEGNRALAYHVKVSDVELGGRVLSRDDEEEGARGIENIGESSRGLLSPSLTMGNLDDASLWANALSQLDIEPVGTIVQQPEDLQPGW